MLQKAASVSSCLGRGEQLLLYSSRKLTTWSHEPQQCEGSYCQPGSLPSSQELRGHQGLPMRAGSSSPALGWAHNKKRTWWLQWNFVGVLCLRPQMQYSTSSQTMRSACIWVVPHISAHLAVFYLHSLVPSLELTMAKKLSQTLPSPLRRWV